MFLREGADVYLCVFLKWVHVRVFVFVNRPNKTVISAYNAFKCE